MKNTPAEKKSLKGICDFCKSEVEKSKMTQHLKYCKQRTVAIAVEASGADVSEPVKTKFFHIVAEGRYNPQYWMHIELPATDVLEDLDFFFRDVWVECCSHLSAFQIGGISYSDEPEDFYFGDEVVNEEEEDTEEEDEEAGNELNLEDLPPQLVEAMTPELLQKLKEFSTTDEVVAFLKEEQKTFPQDLYLRGLMGNDAEDQKLVLKQLLIGELIEMLEDRSLGVPLDKVLKVGQKFRYEYDFGSTTELSLRVAGEREGVLVDEEDDVQILARNIAPEIKCVRCGKPATRVGAGYDYWGVVEHAYCDDCSKKANEDGWLPIVNSPRVGVCAYTGEDDAYIEDEWDEEDEEEELDEEDE
ncbi:MAG TPA: hypothetical protein VJO32_10235 [Ktedonobacteraceae bacterium]|nr:hypothetical protein [Ktedonobacteraceae bacterium]